MNCPYAVSYIKLKAREEMGLRIMLDSEHHNE